MNENVHPLQGVHRKDERSRHMHTIVSVVISVHPIPGKPGATCVLHMPHGKGKPSDRNKIKDS
jgi:hypothetical protein